MNRFQLFGTLLLLGAVGCSTPAPEPTPAPVLNASSTSLDFGLIAAGKTQGPKTVTLTNAGSVPISGFSGGTPSVAQYTLTNGCTGTLNPGASCVLAYSFTPDGTGVFPATAQFQSSAGKVDITLAGSGVADFSVSPLELDFGEVGVGVTSPAQTVTIRNTGTTTLGSFAGGAPFDTQFGASQNCAGGVAPGASCQYIFTFKPTAAGAVSTTSNSSTNKGAIVVRLRGSGVGASQAVTPLDLDFGPVVLGATSPAQTVTISNTGKTTLASFAGGAPFDTQFGASQNCAGGVAVGASCQYTFTFKPTKAGAVSTTSNSSTNAGSIVVNLRGTGVTAAPTGAALSVSPLELDFGEVGVGVTSPAQTVTIRNTGTVTLGSFAGGAPLDTQFGASQSCAGGVAPGATCQYIFTFKPSAAGVVSTTSNSSTNAGPFAIKLRGTGVGAKVSLTPLELDFGTVAVGATSPAQTVTITNTGKTTLGSFAGGAPSDTQFGAAQSCAGGVAPGASCQYIFTFKPTKAGAFSIRLRGNTPATP